MPDAARSIAAAHLALDAHRKAGGIEGDTEIQVWHLLLSLEVFDRQAEIAADLAQSHEWTDTALAAFAQAGGSGHDKPSRVAALREALKVYCQHSSIDFAEQIADVRAELPSIYAMREPKEEGLDEESSFRP